MIIKVLGIVIGVLYLAVNVVMAKNASASEMRMGLIDRQNTVGMICSNLFYAPAWLLKCVRRFIIIAVK